MFRIYFFILVPFLSIFSIIGCAQKESAHESATNEYGLVVIENVPFVKQKDKFCGPAAMASVHYDGDGLGDGDGDGRGEGVSTISSQPLVSIVALPLTSIGLSKELIAHVSAPSEMKEFPSAFTPLSPANISIAPNASMTILASPRALNPSSLASQTISPLGLIIVTSDVPLASTHCSQLVRSILPGSKNIVQFPSVLMQASPPPSIIRLSFSFLMISTVPV